VTVARSYQDPAGWQAQVYQAPPAPLVLTPEAETDIFIACLRERTESFLAQMLVMTA
jgi:hypothetical protein